MPVYEYLPHELARLSVLRKATGLDLNQIMERVRLAQEREARASTGPQEPKSLSELHIAVLQHDQWRRIAHVTAELQMPVYEPAEDPRAIRYEQQRLRRLEEDRAHAGEPDGQAPIELLRHRVYRITGRPLGEQAPGGADFVIHLMAGSLSEAASRAWNAYGRPDGPYRGNGHQITSVEQVLPEPGELF
ncbi:hypothetical protein HYE82_30730 [Streptomyces sp. BR123]|uniref:hypothetical protein n=1 Tax=Streptomyces sp. BR123 TaxID=2749828 RepID=UPI0015C45FD7|nr:hypothetical protein [Streptomyces sp. BR123]NXY98678.1 hypothetical protein [Streptomyces sp. BR123]